MDGVIAAIAGMVLSLLFSYVPGLNTWFAALESTYKRIIMLVLLFLTSAALVGLACAGLLDFFGVTVTCDQPGIMEVVKAFGIAVIANQAAYPISPQTAAVKAAKS